MTERGEHEATAQPALASFLREHQSEILARWCEAIRQRMPHRRLSDVELLDHVPLLFERLVEVIEGGPPAPMADEAAEAPEKHAVTRLRAGFDLQEVLTELFLLRELLLEIVGERIEAGAARFRDVQSVSWALDEALRESLESFATTRQRTLEALEHISAAMAASKTLDELLPRLLGIIVEGASEVDLAALFLVEGDRLRLHAAARRGETLGPGLTLAIGEGHAGRVASERKPLLLRQPLADPLFGERAAGKRGVQALYGMPLLSDGVLLGVLQVGSLTASELSIPDEVVLGAVADRVCYAILQQVARRQAERIGARRARVQAITAALVSIRQPGELARTVCTEGVSLLEAARGHLSLLRGGEVELFGAEGYGEATVAAWHACKREGVGPDMDVLRTGEPVWLDSARAFVERFPDCAHLGELLGPGAWVSIPLVSDGQMIGVFGVSYAAPRSFGDDDKALASEIANLAGQALARALLHEEAQNARRAADEEVARMTGLFATAPIGLAFIDRDLRFVRVNEVAAALGGIPAAAHIGRRLGELLPGIDDIRQVEEGWRRVIRTEQAMLDVEMSGELPGRPGRRSILLNSWYPVHVGGVIVGVGIVTRDVTEERQAKELQQHVLGIVSHDLRSPLSAITMSAKMLLQDESLSDRNTRSALRIQAGAERMERIVRDLFDFTRIRAGQPIPLERRAADLETVCRQVLDEVEAGDPGRTITLSASGDTRGDWDPARLAQAIANLVGNALTHGSPGGPVDVSIGGGDEAVWVEVRNEGAVQPEIMPHIFEPFRRGEGGPQRGLGLGLFITREIVTSHGGTIDVRSDQRQTAFRFTLPRRAPNAGPT